MIEIPINEVFFAIFYAVLYGLGLVLTLLFFKDEFTVYFFITATLILFIVQMLIPQVIYINYYISMLIICVLSIPLGLFLKKIIKKRVTKKLLLMRICFLIILLLALSPLFAVSKIFMNTGKIANDKYLVVSETPNRIIGMVIKTDDKGNLYIDKGNYTILSTDGVLIKYYNIKNIKYNEIYKEDNFSLQEDNPND